MVEMVYGPSQLMDLILLVSQEVKIVPISLLSGLLMEIISLPPNKALVKVSCGCTIAEVEVVCSS